MSNIEYSKSKIIASAPVKPVACRFRSQESEDRSQEPEARSQGSENRKTQMSYRFGDSERQGARGEVRGVVCFVDLAEDGLAIQFYGEKEQTSIHVPAEELVDFADWLNQRLGMPTRQISPDFKSTVRRIANQTGGIFKFRPSDKTKLKRGLKALEMEGEKSD